jgi:hypothetical protein
MAQGSGLWRREQDRLGKHWGANAKNPERVLALGVPELMWMWTRSPAQYSGKAAPPTVAFLEQTCASVVLAEMSDRAKAYREKASECERQAAVAATPSLRHAFQGLAKQWRDVAEKAEALERLRANKSGE